MKAKPITVPTTTPVHDQPMKKQLYPWQQRMLEAFEKNPEEMKQNLWQSLYGRTRKSQSMFPEGGTTIGADFGSQPSESLILKCSAGEKVDVSPRSDSSEFTLITMDEEPLNDAQKEHMNLTKSMTNRMSRQNIIPSIGNICSHEKRYFDISGQFSQDWFEVKTKEDFHECSHGQFIVNVDGGCRYYFNSAGGKVREGVL